MRLIALLCLLASLSACKIVVTVPAGGRVTTASGDFSCEAGASCTIEVTDTRFDQTFIVEPEPGMQWRWRQFHRGLCGGGQDDCHLVTSGFSGNQGLLALLTSDEAFFLEPKFWPVGESEVAAVGRGTLTRTDQLVINQNTRLAIDDRTRIRIDGDDRPSASDLAAGMVVDFQTADDTRPDLASGSALLIEASTEVKGPVTQVSPLRVLGQLVIANGDTVLASIPGGQLDALQVGDELEVYGFRGNRGEILATRIQYRGAGIREWKLVGTVTTVSSDGFAIAGQPILLGSVSPRDCAGPLRAGNTVEARFTRDPDFQPGDALSTALDVECIATGLPSPGNPIASVLPAEVEGIVAGELVNGRFTVAGQVVALADSTRFRNGNRDDLQAGVRVVAEGRVDTDSGVLAAREIRFQGNRVRIEGPLEIRADALALLGIPVQVTAATEDPDDIRRGAANGQQVEVRGYVDGRGAVVAEALRERGAADPGDVRLRGPATAIGDSGFRILGLRIDTDTARSFQGRNGELIDRATFFSRLAEGTIVSVEDASWDGAGTLDNGELQLED